MNLVLQGLISGLHLRGGRGAGEAAGSLGPVTLDGTHRS